MFQNCCHTTVKVTSKDSQNNLLESILLVCCEDIVIEILRTDLISVIADETTDIKIHHSKFTL